MFGSDTFDGPVISGTLIEELPEFRAVRERFEIDFHTFVRRKKIKAIRGVIREELTNSRLEDNLMFLNQVANRLDGEAIVEKRFAFLSINPRSLV